MTDHHEPTDGPIGDVPLDDAALDALTALDPTTAEASPAPGSTRYLSILEHAMTRTADLPDTDDSISDDHVCPPSATRRPRRDLAFAVAAAAVVALVVGIVVAGPGSGPAPASAAEALAQAAETTGEVTTLRAEATYDRPGSTTRITVEGNGGDYRIESVGTYADGREERDSIVSIGETVWDDEGKHVTPPEGRLAAYAPASEAVVEALLEGSTLEDLGDEEVRGSSARHVRVTLTAESRAALDALSPSELAMFELETPDRVDTLDLWVADDLIRKIRVVVNESEDPLPATVVTIEFYDFGADIAITPPY